MTTENEKITRTDKNSSNFRSSTWRSLSPEWKVVNDLWGSPLAVRSKREEYLPKFKREPEEKYNFRLTDSLFTSRFRQACETMSGMVFRSDPRPQNADPLIDDLLTDIDQLGNSFWQWNLDKFERYLRDGNGLIYVDAPPLTDAMKQKVDAGQPLTKQDRSGDHPFWVFYEVSQLINYRYEQVGSRSMLVQATLEEKLLVADGEFGEKEVVRHRILTPGSWRVLELNSELGAFVPTGDEGSTGLDYIPLFPIKPLDTSPPLLQLALLDAMLYRRMSDFDNIVHLVCTPIRVQRYDSKADAEAAKQIQESSPGTGIKMWGEHASVTYTEVEGKGLEVVERRVADIKKDIQEFGVGMFAPTDMLTVRTATEVMDTAGTRQSKLAKLTRDYENAVEKALYTTAEYINAIQGPNTIRLDEAEAETKMQLKIDYDRLTFSLEQLDFFDRLVDSGKLSLETFLHWLPKVADMPPGFDPDEELEKLRNFSTTVNDDEPETEAE